MFKQLGITDEVTDCDHCGRSGLKRTVVLESDATGIVHFGVDCAAKATGRKAGILKTDGQALSKANGWIGQFPHDKIENWLHTRIGNTFLFEGGVFLVKLPEIKA